MEEAITSSSRVDYMDITFGIIVRYDGRLSGRVLKQNLFKKCGIAHRSERHFGDYREALPRDSKGSKRAIAPAAIKIAPAMKIGTELVKSALSAMIGACLMSASDCQVSK